MSDEETSSGFTVRDRRTSSLSEEEHKKHDQEQAVQREKDKQAVDTAAQEDQAPHQIDFMSFIYSLSTSALVHLGLVPDPQTNKTAHNPEQAKQTIDLLGVLQEKTKGNLTDDEQKILDSSLAELRMRFANQAGYR